MHVVIICISSLAIQRLDIDIGVENISANNGKDDGACSDDMIAWFIVLSSFKLSLRSCERCESLFLYQCARAGFNQFLVDFLPSERRLHMSSVQWGCQKELGRS